MGRPFGRFHPRQARLAVRPGAAIVGFDGDVDGADDGAESDDLLDALGSDALDAEENCPPLDPDLLERYALPFSPSLSLTARPYQREAIRNWLRSDGRGVVVLPTGAGKTVVAFLALDEVPVRTLVVVPTIELLRQWRTGLIEKAGVPEDQVGVVGGGERTVAGGHRDDLRLGGDAASAPRRVRPADRGRGPPPAGPDLPRHRREGGAPWRLGLSATPERSDGAHYDLGDADRAGGVPPAAGRAGGRGAHRAVPREADLRRPDPRGAGALRPADGRVEVVPGLEAQHAGTGRPLRAADPAERQRPGRAAGAAGPPPGADDRAQRREQDRPGGRAAGPAPRRPGDRLLGVQRDGRGGRRRLALPAITYRTPPTSAG